MKRKISLALLVIVIFFSSGTVMAIIYIRNITTELDHLLKLHQIEDLRQQLVMSTQSVQSALYTARSLTTHELDVVVGNVLKLQDNAGECLRCHHPPAVDGSLDEIQKLIQAHQRALSFFITASADADRIEALKKETALIGNELLEITEGMSMQAGERLGMNTSSAMAKIGATKSILYFTVFVTFVVGVIVAVRLTMSVIRPVGELVHATRAIASGELGHTISYTDSTEFGELASNFNTMSTALKKGYEELQKKIVERKLIEESLRESEERYRSFVQNFQGIAYRCDREFHIIFLHGAVEKMTGYRVEEFFDMDMQIYDLVHPDDVEMLSANRDIQELPNYSAERNYRIVNRDGRELWIHEIIRNVVDETGAPVFIEGALFDITDRKKIEENMIKAHRLESLGVLAGGIAHDFNNILTGILGNISLALSYVEPGDELYEILTQSEHASVRAKELTQQLLTFSKGGTPVRKSANIVQIVRDAASFALRGSNVRCEFFMSDEVWPVEVDEGQISQVLNNLIINADQAMPDGGSIMVSFENVLIGADRTLPLGEGKYVRISIEDHGIGIPSQHLQKIFDPYFTTKQRGNGLGLAIAYSIVSKHDGYISVESELGNGTTFHIYLNSTEKVVESPASLTKVPFRGHAKVLVMDDEELVRFVSGKMLKKIGCTAAFARDGEEALRLYARALDEGNPFDAVILDLTVPGGMGGKETMQALLSMDPQVKAVVSSGYSNDPVMSDFRAHGFIEVIIKPFTKEELKRTILKVMDSAAHDPT